MRALVSALGTRLRGTEHFVSRATFPSCSHSTTITTSFERDLKFAASLVIQFQTRAKSPSLPRLAVLPNWGQWFGFAGLLP